MRNEMGRQDAGSRVQTFRLEDDDRFPLALIQGNKTLLNSGSPYSFKLPGGPDTLCLLGEEIPLKALPIARGFVETGCSILDVYFDGLIGMNILGRMAWSFDLQAQVVQVSSCPVEPKKSIWIPLDAGFGPPTCALDNGTPVLVDSSSSTSFRIGAVPPTATLLGSVVTWSMVWGRLESELWSEKLRIGGQTFPVSFGKLPPEVESRFHAMGMNSGWIIGSDLLKAFRVTLDFPNGRIGLAPYR